MKKYLLTFVQFLLISTCTYSQFSFIDQTQIYLDTAYYKSRLVAVTDMNNDGLDDLGLLDAMPLSETQYLKIRYQNEPNTPFS